MGGSLRANFCLFFVLTLTKSIRIWSGENRGPETRGPVAPGLKSRGPVVAPGLKSRGPGAPGLKSRGPVAPGLVPRVREPGSPGLGSIPLSPGSRVQVPGPSSRVQSPELFLLPIFFKFCLKSSNMHTHTFHASFLSILQYNQKHIGVTQF